MSDDVVIGEDGLARCRWGTGTPEYQAYHDDEWGRPVADEHRIFEKVCLEGFQSGLSWLTILRKREAFRGAFAQFDPEAVAEFGEADVDRLLADAGIVRHRAKIMAAIGNARATVRLHQAGTSLGAIVWRHEPATANITAPTRLNELPPSTPGSKALSAELKKLGFTFVGPTTAYAAMQALGVVNDHLAGCYVRPEAEAARAAFNRPA